MEIPNLTQKRRLTIGFVIFKFKNNLIIIV